MALFVRLVSQPVGYDTGSWPSSFCALVCITTVGQNVRSQAGRISSTITELGALLSRRRLNQCPLLPIADRKQPFRLPPLADFRNQRLPSTHLQDHGFLLSYP